MLPTCFPVSLPNNPHQHSSLESLMPIPHLSGTYSLQPHVYSVAFHCQRRTGVTKGDLLILILKNSVLCMFFFYFKLFDLRCFYWYLPVC